jgi:hypothetical protein
VNEGAAMSANEEDGPWQAGAVGRTPQDDALVWRNDAVSGPHFYAAGPTDAERATVLLNSLEARIAELSTSRAAMDARVAQLEAQVNVLEMSLDKQDVPSCAVCAADGDAMHDAVEVCRDCSEWARYSSEVKP